MKWYVHSSRIEGTARVPGDKSISHRALMIAAMATGESRIQNLSRGQDVLATCDCLRALGCQIRGDTDVTRVLAADGLRQPQAVLNAANSGTTMRLLTGILAGQRFASSFEGDSSLSRRPMRRVIVPLTEMGASIQAVRGCPPLHIDGRPLRGIHYTLPVASAQVKSAVLLAGLFADGETSVTELLPTRDHTERMLRSAGVDMYRHNGTVAITGRQTCAPLDIDIPGDMSSAAFLFAAAALTGGTVRVAGVGVNPTRTAFLSLLERMGACVSFENMHESAGEPRADVTVAGPVQSSVVVENQDVPGLIDELPLVALLASQARGETHIQGAGELRVKESDRISGIVDLLAAMGGDVRELDDGLIVRGPVRLCGARLRSKGDHRLALVGAVAGLIASGETVVEESEAASVSFPGFDESLRQLGGNIRAG